MAKIIKSIPLLLTRCHCRNELIAHREPNCVSLSDTELDLDLDSARGQCRSSPFVIPSLSIRAFKPQTITKKVTNLSLKSMTNVEFEVCLMCMWGKISLIYPTVLPRSGNGQDIGFASVCWLKKQCWGLRNCLLLKSWRRKESRFSL